MLLLCAAPRFGRRRPARQQELHRVAVAHTVAADVTSSEDDARASRQKGGDGERAGAERTKRGKSLWKQEADAYRGEGDGAPRADCQLRTGRAWSCAFERASPVVHFGEDMVVRRYHRFVPPHQECRSTAPA